MHSFNPKTGVALALLAMGSLTACAGSGSGDANASEAPNDAAKLDRATPSATMTKPAVPAGAMMTFSLDESVSTDDAKKGDYVMSTLSSDAMGSNGQPLLHAGTKGRWVVLASSKDDGQGEAVLAVGLNAVQVDGQWIPVDATVTSADLDKDAKDTDVQTGAKIAMGAAAGALIGKIVGKTTTATVEGAGVGAAVGTAVALKTRGASATLHEGARLAVRLDQKLVVDQR